MYLIVGKMMIQQMFLLLGLGVFLASCESGTGDKEKTTPFSMNSLDSIIVGTNQATYPVSGTCHEEGTVITVTVNDTFNNTLAVEPSTPPTCSSKAWSTTVDVSSLSDGTLTVVAGYGEGDFTQEKTVSKDTVAPTIRVSSPDNIHPSTKNAYEIDGTCSENQREVGLTLSDSEGASLSPPSQTLCSGKTWEVSGWNVSSLADGDITLTLSQSDATGNSTEQTETIIKSSSDDTRVTVSTASAINISNVAAYTLRGTCVAGVSGNTIDTVTVTVGGIRPESVPTCRSNTWSATFNLTNVGDGANIAISASYKDALIATAGVLKDVVAPTVTLNTPPDVNRMTDSTYTLSGDCNESGRAVRVVAQDSESTPNKVSAQANCATTQWQKTMDITSLQAGTLNLSVSHSDLAGNEATARGTATRADDVIMTLTTPSHIDDDNELSYGVSGTCSEEGEEITLSVGSVSASSTPTCISFAWGVTGLDVSGLADGPVTITAVHGSVTQTAFIYKGCTPGVGNGLSAATPIIICGYDDLNDMRKDLDSSGHIAKHYALGLDIDATPSWSAHNSNATCTAYNGTNIAGRSTPCSGFAPLPKLYGSSFDGKGYTISKLYIYAGGDKVGLFSSSYSSSASSPAVIKNLHLKSVRVHSTSTASSAYTGGIVGDSAYMTISESSVEGEISGSGDVGGIVGSSSSNGNVTIKNSYADVTLIGGQWVGGIVGILARSGVFNSHTRGSVTRTGSSSFGATGGIAGGLDERSEIRNSYAHVSVSGTHWVGSLTGGLGEDSTVDNSYGTGPVGGTSTSKGGIAGSIATGGGATVTNNFWDTETTGQAANTAQGTGLTTTEMKAACGGESTTGICALGSAFVFTQGSYPKVKKCESGCGTDSPTLSEDLVIGQD